MEIVYLRHFKRMSCYILENVYLNHSNVRISVVWKWFMYVISESKYLCSLKV